MSEGHLASRVPNHHLRLTPWDRGWAADAAVHISALLGWFPPARVDVVETDSRIVISMYVRWPTSQPGEPVNVRALGRTASFELPLASPVGHRTLVDGATSAPPRQSERPDDIGASRLVVPIGEEFDYDAVAPRPWLPDA